MKALLPVETAIRHFVGVNGLRIIHREDYQEWNMAINKQ